MRKGARRSGASGMSLVEVTVAMGIASGVSLAVMQLINQSQKANRAVTISSEWNSFVALVQSSLNNDDVCANIFAKSIDVSGGEGTAFVATNAGGTHTYSASTASPLSITRLDAAVPNNSGGLSSVRELAVRGKDYSTFTLTKINLKRNGAGVPMTMIAPALPGLSASLVGQPLTFTKYQVEITLEATKAASAGMVPGVQTLGTRPMPFTIITGPNVNPADGSVITATDNEIFSCFGASSPAQVCSELGGVYSASASPPCKLSNLFLGENDSAEAPSVSGNPGMRIQLYGNHGDARASDYAIGIDSKTMWFNAGSATDRKFLFTNNSGKRTLATLNADKITDEPLTYTMPCFSLFSTCTPTTVTMGTIPVLTHGTQLYESVKIGTTDTTRELWVTGKTFLSGDLSVNGNSTMFGSLTIDPAGSTSPVLTLTNENGKNGSLYMDTADNLVMINPGTNLIWSGTSVMLAAGGFGSAATATLESDGDFKVDKLKANSIAVDELSAKVKPKTGGTVLYDCRQISWSANTEGDVTLYCGKGEWAISGGIRCSEKKVDGLLAMSRPTAAAAGEKLGTGWQGRCDDDDGTSIFVTCCKR